MNAASETRLSQLMPEFARRVGLIADRLTARGFQVEITQGLRTFAEQDGLYSQGRTRKGSKVTKAKGGQSLHNYGIAADFALIVNGKYTWPDPHPIWKAIGEEAKKVGLEAGVNWSQPDQPHVEWPNVGWRELLDWHKQGGIQEVWKRLNA
jgi:peptidoglycan L-alanyl-D-glutamate endopeptidase CwlK